MPRRLVSFLGLRASRILWEDWEECMADGMHSRVGTPEIVMVSPSITAVEWGEMTFADIPQSLDQRFYIINQVANG